MHNARRREQSAEQMGRSKGRQGGKLGNCKAKKKGRFSRSPGLPVAPSLPACFAWILLGLLSAAGWRTFQVQATREVAPRGEWVVAVFPLDDSTVEQVAEDYS